MRIFAIATDSAGCWWYRLHLPLTNLDPARFQVIWGPPDPERQPGDVVIGQRIAGHNQAWLDMCADPELMAVYELDDYLLKLDPDNVVPYQIYAPQAEETARNIAAADVVTVSTPAMADAIRKLNPNVVVLPNCVSPEWLTTKVDDPITVGWAGSMFHEQDWPGIPDVLAEYNNTEPRAKWHMIGADYTRNALGPIRVTGWGGMDGYRHALDFSVGIAPLNKTEFNSFKSHCKLIEYAARGIPAVATAWGQYPEFIDDGVTGLLVESMDEWVPALRALSDDTVRAAMGAAAQAKADLYRIDRQVYRWESVYEGRWS